MMSDLSPELSVALEAVVKAERVAMKYFGQNPAVRIKPDQSPVSQADIESEAVMVETIHAHFPGHTILGEESGMSAGAGEFMWVIDPIDGTKNFIRGIPLFGIELALVHEGKPIVGVSSIPALGERLFAQKGHGAYRDSLNQRVHVSAIDRLEDAYVNLGGLNHFARRGEEDHLLRIVNTAGRLRATGDAYAYHLLATGRCEAVMEARLSFWDVAALSVIVTEAGGRCTDLDGKPIGAETKSTLFSNARLNERLLGLYWNRKSAQEQD